MTTVEKTDLDETTVSTDYEQSLMTLATVQQLSWSPILAVTACVSIFSIMIGLTYPLFPLILEAQGIDKGVIGLNAAMTPIGLILSAPLIPRLARRWGAWLVAVASTVLAIFILLLLAVSTDLGAWFVLRLLLGITMNGIFVTSEAWINQLANTETRGRLVGLYTTIYALGFAVGPFLIALTGTEGTLPFVVCAAFSGLALLVLMAGRRGLPEMVETPSGERVSWLRFMQLAPSLMLAVAVFGIFDTASLALLPIYGVLNGLDATMAANALGIHIIGSALLQFPIGWLADRLTSRTVMRLCSLIAIVCCLLLPAAVASPLTLWPLLFVLGGVTFGIYTAALISLGEHFSGAMLLTGNAVFAQMWAIGAVMGPPMAGFSLEAMGAIGLPIVCVSVLSILLVILSMSRGATANRVRQDLVSQSA